MACNVTNSPGTVFLSWDHAEDPSPPIVYNVYMANVSGGQNFSSPLDSTNMTWYEINELEDEMYYFVVRAEDAWDNEDNNTVEKSVRPFVDTSSPIITDMEANPSVQTFGGCVNITCEVRDNTKIDTVKVNITYPNESYVNQTMIHILGTDNYYYNSTYTDIGTYYYFIWANDTYNNAYTSSTHSFAIIDPPPEITNVTDYPDPQLTGGYVNISCDASDNVEVDVVKVNITYPNSETVNETMGGSYFYNTTYALSGTYSYYIWANDTNGNENVSAVYTFNIGPIINLDTGELFFTIQNAIDDSDTLDGHTIFVHNDTYYENIVIDKSINLIGEKRENTVIDGSRSDTVVSVVAPGVNISGFTIQNSSSDWGDAGISVSSNHTNITGNIITNNSWANGIFVTASSHTTISENTIKNNYYGVYLEDGSSLNTISWNTIRTNQLGIYVYTSSFNTILENTITYNNEFGIYLHEYSSNNIIFNNDVINHLYGIYLDDYSNNNHIYHNNFINNTWHAYDTWNNIYNNQYPSGGNYWSDYYGDDEYRGPSQDIPGSDGIGDTPYYISGGSNRDWYPLMYFWSGVIGDLDGDGDVDLSDLAQLLAHYGTIGDATYWMGDIDGDGDVDLSDLAALLANYGTGT